MNDQQLEKKIRQDVNKVSKDIDTLLGDGAIRLGRFEAKVSQSGVKAKEDLITWVEENTSQMGEGIEKVTDSFAQKISSHPWIAISIGLSFGFLLGSLIKPARLILK
jgi:ElaB/YqjD/DUF883 family membrane-anchored ribosome-binding protein